MKEIRIRVVSSAFENRPFGLRLWTCEMEVRGTK